MGTPFYTLLCRNYDRHFSIVFIIYLGRPFNLVKPTILEAAGVGKHGADALPPLYFMNHSIRIVGGSVFRLRPRCKAIRSRCTFAQTSLHDAYGGHSLFRISNTAETLLCFCVFTIFFLRQSLELKAERQGTILLEASAFHRDVANR